MYAEPDGRWRWCYRRPDDGVELHSNRSYVSYEAAEHSALQAYPDTPLARPVEASGSTSSGPRPTSG